MLAKAAAAPAMQCAFIEEDESEEVPEVSDGEQLDTDGEVEEADVNGEGILAYDRYYGCGLIYEFAQPELQTHFVFISRPAGLTAKVSRPPSTTSVIHIELSYAFPTPLLFALVEETAQPAAYIEAHCPARTFSFDVCVTIDKYQARVIENLNCVVIKIVGQEKSHELTIQ